VKSEKKIQDRR